MFAFTDIDFTAGQDDMPPSGPYLPEAGDFLRCVGFPECRFRSSAASVVVVKDFVNNKFPT